MVSVHAYGIAATLKPAPIAAELGLRPVVRQTKTFLLAALDGGGHVAFHDFGAVVFFDAAPAAQKDILARVLLRLPPEPHPPIVDDYLLEVQPGATPTATFDRAVVPAADPVAMELVSLVLAQSVAMDYYDEDVAALFARLDVLSNHVADRGRLRETARHLHQLVGRIMVTRNQIVMTLSLLDAPLITWDAEVYDRLHTALRAAFEIDDRYRTLEQKLRLIQDNLQIIVDLAQNRHSTRLELIVIALIAVELVLALVRR